MRVEAQVLRAPRIAGVGAGEGELVRDAGLPEENVRRQAGGAGRAIKSVHEGFFDDHGSIEPVGRGQR